ncbi:MAG: creatininase family protein [Candidatus Abyssobacteria bacterium SURF_5]|uniref:Creatininase family protein n=1 Tax=Abyssobacteria bacterium (strain SURF_5) TaxID=2093360 RepID=A0A3A4NL73_ABYX5|nr:MAG: creatininase family protein [Candidatus Abyssubacteria bacterium SURF_5]
MTPNIFKAEEMLYPQMRDLDREKTLLILPVSALEVHGHHLPMGMDTFSAATSAAGVAELFAKAHPDWSVVVYPPLTLGTDELPLPGSISVSPRTVRSAVMGFGKSLARHGFKYIVITNGHGGPRHSPAIEEACHRISLRKKVAMFAPSIRVLHPYTDGRAIPKLEAELGRPLTDLERRAFATGGEHAGVLETSIMLAYRPDLVSDVYKRCEFDQPPRVKIFFKLSKIVGGVLRLARLRRLADKATLILNGLGGTLGWLFNSRWNYGDHLVTYSGIPKAGSAEIGSAAMRLLAKDLLEEVEAVIHGKMLPSQVHSLMWTVPLIRTDFFRNLGFAAAGLFLIFIVGLFFVI